MQIPTPGEAQAWTEFMEKLGVVGVIFLAGMLFVVAIVRKWFAPWYVVEMKDARIAQLEKREELLFELALRGTAASETALDVLKRRQ